METPLLEIRNLSLTRSGVPVLHDVSFDVAAGDVLMIVGPSGGGKSSLLRCLNRLEEPEPGMVRLNGQDITGLGVRELRRRVGLIFQKTAPFPGTVAENIAYGPALWGESLSQERIHELMDAAGLEAKLIDRPAKELSGGQEQRLAIARALANEPEVLLLDEPTSALDPVMTHRVEESLCALRDRLGLTLIWVSHAIEQVRRIGGRVLLLEAGRVAQLGAVDALLDEDNGNAQLLAFAAGEESSS